MQRLQYTVQGMSCAACVWHVERAVKSVLSEGDRFSVSLLTNSLSVLTQNDLSDREKELLEGRLARAVHAAGYRLLTSPVTKQKKDDEYKKRRNVLIISAIFTLALMYLSMGHMLSLPQIPFLSGAENALWQALAQLALALPVVILNFKFFRSGFSALIHRAPNMDSLIAVGSGASLIYGVFAIGMIALAAGNEQAIHAWVHNLYFESAAMILTLVSFGKLLESRAKDKAADAVKAFSALSPKYATVLREGGEQTLSVDELKLGDVVLIRTGEMIPVDGEVIGGFGSADESTLTGESMPVDKTVGDAVKTACVLTSGVLTVKATGVGEDTSLARLIRLLEDAAASKAPIARIADRVSAVFVPIVMLISLCTFALWMLFSGSVEEALKSAISVLVISCPCALGLATPTAITVAIGRGAKFGILFCNAEALEKLGSVKTVVFDKTGTLTEGRPVLSELYAYGTDPESLLLLAAAVEHNSSHPLARAVQAAAAEREKELPAVTDFEETVGMGVRATYNNKSLFVGKPDANFQQRMQNFGANSCSAASATPSLQWGSTAIFAREDDPNFPIIDFLSVEHRGMTAVTVTLDGAVIGVLGIADRIRDDACTAIQALKTADLTCLMLTGDNERTALHVAQKLNLDGFRASLLPEDKEQAVRELSQQAPTAMVGDGINDSPALVRADVGIAVGAGTEVAIDSADVVLSGSSPTGVHDAYRLSRATMRIIKQNLFWALFYNAVCIPLAAGAFYPLFGWQLSPMVASAAMSLSSVCVVTNALRLRRVPLTPPVCPVPQNSQSKGNDPMFFSKKAKPETHTIQISGMMCPRCVEHVKHALTAVPGVLDVSVSLETNSATVSATAPLSDLTSAIISAGYEVV